MIKYPLKFTSGIAVFITLLFFTSCEETITLDLEQAPPITIINGEITNELKHHEIILSQSVAFEDKGAAPRVSGAEVWVEDDEGNRFDFAEQAAGVYAATEAFAGRDNHEYFMTVKLEGETYTASELLRVPALFDSLSVQLNTIEEIEPEEGEEDLIHEVLMYIKEPQETVDYYLFKLYQNGEILNDEGEEVWYSDDIALGESINSFPIPYYYALGDTARVELYNISRTAFRYYDDLWNNLNSDGGMFDGVPANVRTNIEGGALGYFRANGVAVAEIVVK